MNGHNLTKKLRTGGFKNPIIMLITQSDASNVDNKLTIEANEYIIKPFKYPALLKSIELQLRQFGKQKTRNIILGLMYLNQTPKFWKVKTNLFA